MQLIKSLERFDYKNAFFCDANSSDRTVSIIENSIFRNNILKKNKLEGFSKNNNDIIRHFKLETKYYLLLNPDLYFDEDFIVSLYEKMESNSIIGIATPTILYPNKILQKTWKKFPSVWSVIKKRLGISKTENEDQMNFSNIDWCLGACMMITNKLLKPNGTLLDERYRLYCEDVDICFEAKQMNLLVFGDNDSYAYHHLNEMSSKKIFSKYNYWNISSIVKFAFKWNWKYFVK
jgi:GT2 family glycosyltransferase